MIDFNRILQAEDVLLRPISREDAASFKALTREEPMWTYFTSDLSLENELDEWINSALKQLEEQSRLAFSIIDKSIGKIVGSTSFGNISRRDQRIEIGWTWLGQEYLGQGLNDQAKYLMIKHCFEDLDVERVEFKTDVLNAPARRALTRIGMVEEGILRSHTLMTHGRRRDTVFYSLLRAEWAAIKIRNAWG
ncbi:GNAT family N-acetyltransferase [Geopsychrobacter electrodiphilus]|uniref:GNAT family N-acetyltransferase n=1 Tax=Geopsychrobacter electrodiphilus TaxID=225196 RepID=UPI000526DF56|nr:GNAT family protein [Geopsychrobacter electrodiphilus]